MEVKLTFKRQTRKNLVQRFYACGEGQNPDYSISMCNRAFIWAHRRHKEENGDLSGKDINITFDELPEEVRKFILSN